MTDAFTALVEARVPVVQPAAIADATGAGDVFTGTVAARLALGDGDDVETALHAALAAASRSLAVAGGTAWSGCG